MIVYSGTKTDFLSAVEEDSIAEEIEKNIYEKMHRSTGRRAQAEANSDPGRIHLNICIRC